MFAPFKLLLASRKAWMEQKQKRPNLGLTPNSNLGPTLAFSFVPFKFLLVLREVRMGKKKS
jgi:hypothetical protein